MKKQLPHVNNNSRRSPTYKVEFHPDGVLLESPSIGNPTGKGLTKGRGKIKGWSLSSRRRMRRFLLTHQIRPDYDSYSATLTIPGPPITFEESQKLFNHFCVKLRRMDGCMVWRKEIQMRGSLHWHAIIGLPSELKPYGDKGISALNMTDRSLLSTWSHSIASSNPREYQRISREAMIAGHWYGCAQLQQAWLTSIHMIPAPDKDQYGRPSCCDRRDQMKGAQLYAAQIIHMPDSYGAWKRYLLDHATKAKQEQVPEHMGRDWGTPGKKHFIETTPVSYEFPDRETYYRVIRWYNRLCTPVIKDHRDPFRRRKGKSYKRAYRGSYVAFSNPETVMRMVRCVKGEYDEPREDIRRLP